MCIKSYISIMVYMVKSKYISDLQREYRQTHVGHTCSVNDPLGLMLQA